MFRAYVYKGAYGALFKSSAVSGGGTHGQERLKPWNERRTGDIKTVLNEDIEKLELFLAHNLPDLVCYLVGPVVIFIYLMTVNCSIGVDFPCPSGSGRGSNGNNVPQYR